ncbi:MAG: hypothetical protein IT537_26910, partial [Hyphomicrobiales bacterium]|nr:hypothetical protein [Hyphomicrobiales bacterium]
ALGVATAALPPVWGRLDEIAAATLAQLHPPILTLADTDRETTGTVAKSEADLRALLLSAAAVVPFVGGTTAAEPVAVDAKDASLPTRVESLQRALEATRKSLEGLEQAVNRMRTSERRLALTLILQSAMRDGRPFVNELEWLRRSASDDVTAAAVDVLLPYARRGVATVSDLRDTLIQTEFADAVRRAALSETSYLDRMQRGVTDWVADFGPMQKPKPLDVDAILDEARLAVQRLEGPPATLMAPWVARAEVRLLIDDMVQRVLQSSAGPG